MRRWAGSSFRWQWRELIVVRVIVAGVRRGLWLRRLPREAVFRVEQVLEDLLLGGRRTKLPDVLRPALSLSND